MRTLTAILVSLSFAPFSIVESARADVYVEAEGALPAYGVFDGASGSSEWIDGEEVLVIPEPAPAAVIEEAPPLEAPYAVAEPPAPPYVGAIWVGGYWSYAAAGFVWVEGHYVAPRQGFVFVAPRWSFSAGYFHYFPGYYRPCGAYVQTYFNPFYFYRPYPYARYSSPPRYYPYQHSPGYGYHDPGNRQGPYWPVGAPRQARAVPRATLPPSQAPASARHPRALQPTSPSRGAAWPSSSPSAFRAPSYRSGTSRGFTPSRSLGPGSRLPPAGRH